MAEQSKRPKGRDGALLSLNVAIDGLNIAKELSSITPATAVFGSVSILLTMIKVRFLLCCDEVSRIHTWLGHHGQRTGLRRAWTILR